MATIGAEDRQASAWFCLKKNHRCRRSLHHAIVTMLEADNPAGCGKNQKFWSYVMDLALNLKVCEACGCLWLRPQLETRVYCSVCLERLKHFPTTESRKRRGRPRKINLPTLHAVAIPTLLDRSSHTVVRAFIPGILATETRASAPEACSPPFARQRPLPAANLSLQSRQAASFFGGIQ